MRDYESVENFSNGDDQGNFALFVYQDWMQFCSICLSRLDAAKSANLRCAMDSEIEAMRKNDTWISLILLMVKEEEEKRKKKKRK